jgi:activating signal cointegrator complex subunit 1
LRERVTRFTDALVNATPPIPGIDRSIMVDPRRLSIPLVRMSLDDETLPKAKDALTALRPQVLDIIAALNTGSSNVRLRAPLTQIRVTRPYRNDIRHAHVMFAGASRSDPDWQALWTLAGKLPLSSS